MGEKVILKAKGFLEFKIFLESEDDEVLFTYSIQNGGAVTKSFKFFGSYQDECMGHGSYERYKVFYEVNKDTGDVEWGLP